MRRPPRRSNVTGVLAAGGVDLATTISAVASVITALGGLILSVTYVIPAIRTLKTTKDEVAKVHELVNGQATNQTIRISDLTDSLTHAGIAVPRDKSLPAETS